MQFYKQKPNFNRNSLNFFYFLVKKYEIPFLLYIYFIWIIGFHILLCEKYDHEIGAEQRFQPRMSYDEGSKGK